MKATQGKSPDEIPSIRSRIDSCLDMQDEQQDRPSGIDSPSGFAFFKRERASAERTADRIMDRIMAEKAFIPAGRTIRIGPISKMASILAAAVLLVIVSSTVTAFIIKRQNVAEITFVLIAPDARSVSLVGDFNGWSLKSDQLKKTNVDGSWKITVRLPKGRAYNYNFVLDDTRWIVDPQALFKLDDGMGGTVSSLVL